MARHVRTYDVHRWVSEQLEDISSRGAKLAAEAGRSGTGA